MGDSRSFDAFIFDLDGTLLDTMPDLVEVTNQALRELGFPPRTTEEIHSFVGLGARTLMYQAVPENTPQAEADEALAHWKKLYPEIGFRLTKPYPDMVETLHELKSRGVKLGVLSNKYEGGVLDVVPRFLPGLFDVMHGESDEIPRKPDPTGLLRSIKEAGATPERTVYIGDSGTDMEVAKRAGAYALGVSWGYNPADSLRDAGADAIIDGARELLRFAKAQ